MKDGSVDGSRNFIFKGSSSQSLYFPWHQELSSGFRMKPKDFLLQCSGNHGKLLAVFFAVSDDKIDVLRIFFL